MTSASSDDATEDEGVPTGSAPDESEPQSEPESGPAPEPDVTMPEMTTEPTPGDEAEGAIQPDEPDEPDGAYDGYGRYEAFPVEEEYHTALPRKVEAWRQRSATGAILTGMALGFQQALGAERREPAIVVQTSGDPPRDLPVEADFEFRRPRQSVVNIRPWLLESSDATAEEPDSKNQPPSEEGRSEPPEP